MTAPLATPDVTVTVTRSEGGIINVFAIWPDATMAIALTPEAAATLRHKLARIEEGDA